MVKKPIRMFVLLWVSLLFSMRSSSSDADASLREQASCHKQFCITLTEGEITAEAGLCVVIPCSFTTSHDFTPKHLVWFRCEKKCSDSDIIFHSNRNNNKTQSGFRGRVSLLHPDLSLNNCSIIINDLRESDSGSYQLRVNGFNSGRLDGFTFSPKATVTIRGLSQKPTVTVPPLTEGQQATLTCTAPGLCSGSAPKITWTWRKTGDVTGNVTENLTAVTQRHSSTLTFDPSAKHHGSEVTCKVSFSGDVTTEETVTLKVNYVKNVRISGNTSVEEGATLNLTCSVESVPPSFVMWTKVSDLQNNSETHLQEESGISSLSNSNVTAEDSGTYMCSVKHLNITLKKAADVTVIYFRKPEISGNPTVFEGDALNLTCSVDSFPPSLIMWSQLGSNSTLHSGTGTNLQNDTGSSTLFIPHVTAGQSGRYICIVKHLDTTLTVCVNVSVACLPKILSSSCNVQSDVLTCVCVSGGFPVPTITWPLLRSHTEYSVTTAVSNHTVSSTVVVVIKEHGNRSVECVASNKHGEVKENLNIQMVSEIKGTFLEMLQTVSWLKIVVAFFTGVLLSAVVCCLAKQCRKKQKRSGNLDETLQMSSQEDPLIYDGPALVDDQTCWPERVDDGDVSAEKLAAPKDVEYASIDFSLLKRKSPREVATKESTKTEYAEIKKDLKEEREDNDGEKGEMEEDDETQSCVTEEEGEEDMAVYSNVQDIMGDV